MQTDLLNCGWHGRHTRRHFLFGAAGASASLLMAHSDAEVTSARNAVTPRGSARACIFINLAGGPSHLDTFDPKDGPWNPPDADIRDYSGGVRLSRYTFPTLSNVAGDLCVLRSVRSWEAAHERGQYYVETGHPLNPAFANEVPHIGAVVAKEKAGSGKLPPFLGLNANGMRGASFLGGRYAPLQAPVWGEGQGLYTLKHEFYGATSRQVFDEKFALLESLDAPLRQAPFNQAMADYTDFYRQARSMMYDDAVASVFQFSREDNRRYGNSGIGNSLLIARNAVQKNNGAVFIWVSQPGWDTHDKMFDPAHYLSFYLAAWSLDRALGNLIADLKASGHLGSTLIVTMGEFGRTPGALNARGGRDHYRDCMSVLMAGGGARGGVTIGATDATGSQITDTGWHGNRPIYPEDVAATIYSALGIDWTKSIADTPSSRRFFYVEGAAEGQYEPVWEVFG